jgi:phosphoribosylamine--glycine ligase
MRKLNQPYNGFLYAGLMICNNEPYLIEYNIRMGDPECQALMMRLKTDLVKIIDRAMENKLKDLKIEWFNRNSITIALCAKGYPGTYIKNSEIKNLSKITSNKKNQIFHAGTYLKNNKIYSSGGRVLNITTSSENLSKARNEALNKIKKINWKDGFFRKDIGWRVINKK